LGVVLCELLTGAHPFYTPKVDDEQSVKANITCREPVEFPSAILPGDEPSRSARDLCLALLQKNPRKRLSARQALVHPWFKDPNKPTPYGNVDALNSSIFDALVKYKSDNKLKRAVFQIYASEISEIEIQELCGKFMALDTQGDGLLSAEELAEAARRMGHELPLDTLREVVAALDASGQGRIGYKEFAAALVERGLGLDESRLQDCFNKFDGSGSGRISYEDVNKVLFAGDGAIPGITPSEWEEIVNPGSNPERSAPNSHRQKDNTDEKSAVELSLEAFMTLMLSQDGNGSSEKNGHDEELERATCGPPEKNGHGYTNGGLPRRRSSPSISAIVPPDAPSELECRSEQGDTGDETTPRQGPTTSNEASSKVFFRRSNQISREVGRKR
jgi:Ca2+-binding EF-hand superfamily protein